MAFFSLKPKKNLLRVVYLLFATAAIAVSFNNCSKVAVSESDSSIMKRLSDGAALFINNDAEYTNDKNVSLTLVHNSATEMFVTNDPTCQSGGSWEPYAKSKPWVLSKENIAVKVFSKFRENASSLESGCYDDSITHDNIPPVLVLGQAAPKFTNLATTNIKFTASDNLSGIQSLSCADKSGAFVSGCKEDLSMSNTVEGPLSVSILARDKAGNQSLPLQQAWVYDKTPPRVIFNSTPSSVSNQTQSPFSFSGTDNLSTLLVYECKADGNAYAVCTSPISINLPEGTHRFFVRAKDEAGNVSAEISYAWKIDLTAPTVQITSNPPAFSNNANAAFSFVGSDDGQPLARYECQFDGGAYAACTSPKSQTLAEGAHQFQVRGYDNVGNVSAPAVYSWVIDLTKPTVQITTKPPAVTRDNSAVLAWTAMDNLSGVDFTECSLNSGAFSKCSNTLTYANLAEGVNKFAVRAVDKSGNVSATAEYSWLVDRTPPTLRIISGPAVMTKDPNAQIVMQVADNSGATPTIQCRRDTEVAYSVCSEIRNYTGLLEGPHTFYARATDSAGNVSAEVTYSWTIDLMGPVITFTQIPLQKISTDDTAKVEFTVTDAISGVDTVSCGLNAANANCGVTKVETFANLAAGVYEYIVTARDRVGNVSTNKVSWTVEKASRLVNQSVAVNISNKADVLVVIDNSGSMNAEQTNMAQRFSTFFDKLNGLDWQVGIVTTDLDSNTAKRDGRLLEFTGLPGKYILSSSMDLNSAKTAFSATIQRPANEGSGNEQGIGASYRAIQRSLETTKAESAPNVAFFRANSALTILVVTDANETNPAGTQARNVPQNLINLVQTTFPQKPFLFHSIVVKSGDAACLARDGNEQYGTSYEQLSRLTGGIIGSVCEANYSNQLTQMAQSVVDLVKSVTLQCVPLDTNNDGVPDVSVTLSTGAPAPAFTVDMMRLTFSTPLPAGQHQISYRCL